jgi:hypothetical protein
MGNLYASSSTDGSIKVRQRDYQPYMLRDNQPYVLRDNQPYVLRDNKPYVMF